MFFYSRSRISFGNDNKSEHGFDGLTQIRKIIIFYYYNRYNCAPESGCNQFDSGDKIKNPVGISYFLEQ